MRDSSGPLCHQGGDCRKCLVCVTDSLDELVQNHGWVDLQDEYLPYEYARKIPFHLSDKQKKTIPIVSAGIPVSFSAEYQSPGRCGCHETAHIRAGLNPD